MPDNTGPYLNYDELIVELYYGNSTFVTVVTPDLTLGAKTNDAGGDIFPYTAGLPKVGDVVYQDGNFDLIIELLTGPNRIRVESVSGSSTLVAGTAKQLHSDKIPLVRGNAMIKEAMDYIDEQTGQFFNKRHAIVSLEGNNTPTMWLPVPIISIDELLINSTDLELLEGEDKDFVAFKGRALPQDDRRNPRIKLNVGRGRDSIFTGAITNRVFSKETLTTIDGYFGFLEADGSTPSQIKLAVQLYIAKKLNQSVASTGSSGPSAAGPLKRIRVDLHEKEFFEVKSQTSAGSISGDVQLDQILAKYKAPIRIKGSIRIIPLAGIER